MTTVLLAGVLYVLAWLVVLAASRHPSPTAMSPAWRREQRRLDTLKGWENGPRWQLEHKDAYARKEPR